MADKLRLNKAIELLEQGKTVFSTGTVPSGNIDDITFVADSDFDMIILETEHEAFGFEQLECLFSICSAGRTSLRKGTYSRTWSPSCAFRPTPRKPPATSG